MIIQHGPAQMIVASPEYHYPRGHGHEPGAWFLHNRSTDTEVWFDIHQNVNCLPGSTTQYIPPNSVMVVSGYQTLWAACAEGKHAELAIIPAASFGMQGTTSVVPSTFAQGPG